MNKETLLNITNKLKNEKLKKDEMRRRILEKYSIYEQVEIVLHKESKPDKYNAFREFFAKVKADIEKEFSELEST